MERFSFKAFSPSDTHCSTFIGFMGMVSGLRPSFAITGVSVGPGRHHRHMHAQRLELDVKRFAETMDIGLGGPVVRHIRKAITRAHRSHKQQPALSAHGELLAEVMRNVEMRQGIEPQKLFQFFPIDLEELARISSARIGHHKANIEVIGGFREISQESRLREILHDRAVLHVKIFRNLLPHLFEQGFPPGYEHDIDARSAIWRANSRPMPDEAPVINAHGPNCRLSSPASIDDLPSFCRWRSSLIRSRGRRHRSRDLVSGCILESKPY